MSEAWPDLVRQEIIILSLTAASTALPHGMTEAAIKQGRVAFPWKLVRSWIKPLVDPPRLFPHDAVVLELPLKVVTPAFVASFRANRSQKKFPLTRTIPNLFSGSAGAEPVAVPPTAAAPLPALPPLPHPSPQPRMRLETPITTSGKIKIKMRRRSRKRS